MMGLEEKNKINIKIKNIILEYINYKYENK